jgi:hypothetical protein
MIADVTRSVYPDAAARLVLEPLGMSDSSFPVSWSATDAVTGYRVSRDMAFVPAPAVVCAVPAAGGMWTTAADLVRWAYPTAGNHAPTARSATTMGYPGQRDVGRRAAAAGTPQKLYGNPDNIFVGAFIGAAAGVGEAGSRAGRRRPAWDRDVTWAVPTHLAHHRQSRSFRSPPSTAVYCAFRLRPVTWSRGLPATRSHEVTSRSQWIRRRRRASQLGRGLSSGRPGCRAIRYRYRSWWRRPRT